jgi:hypothetical protein
MSRNTNPNYGYIDPDDINDYNQDFIDTIIKLKAINKVEVPKNLELLSNQYTEKRKIIEKFDHANYDNAMASGIEAAKELGNYNEFSNKIVLLNDSEMNIFFDYIALYRELDGKRAIINWYLKKPDLINEENKELIKAYEQANFGSVAKKDQLRVEYLPCIVIGGSRDGIQVEAYGANDYHNGSSLVSSLLPELQTSRRTFSRAWNFCRSHDNPSLGRRIQPNVIEKVS